MKSGASCLAVIPARGGSKGIPLKNIVPFCGMPLIGWTLKAAREAGCIARTIVSTDSEEIAECAVKLGGDVPFLRPAELATDRRRGVDAVLHAVDWLEKQGERYDNVIYLQPTSPLRRAEDIRAGYAFFMESGADFCVSVCELDYPPGLICDLDAQHRVRMRSGQDAQQRQLMGAGYRINGALYIAGIERLKKHGSFMHPETAGYLMPRLHSIDIDSPEDLLLAAALHEITHRSA